MKPKLIVLALMFGACIVLFAAYGPLFLYTVAKAVVDCGNNIIPTEISQCDARLAIILGWVIGFGACGCLWFLIVLYKALIHESGSKR